MSKKTSATKERLNAHRDMLEKLAALKQELDYTEAQYGSTPGRNHNDLMREEAIDSKKTELEKRVKEKETEIEADWAELEPFVEKLSPIETLVVNLRYYYGAEWDEIHFQLFGKRHDYVDEIDRYQNRTFKIHGRALLALAEMMEKVENSAGLPQELRKNVSKKQ